jgi:hypothetical protein
MTNLEHKFYLADLERSFNSGLNLPNIPRGVVAVLLMVCIFAAVGVATV